MGCSRMLNVGIQSLTLGQIANIFINAFYNAKRRQHTHTHVRLSVPGGIFF